MRPGRPTAIIAEDEPHLARFLVERLQACWPELDIRGVAGNGIEARDLLETERPQVAFLDIRMPGMSGLDVARTLDGIDVVFVTAYDEYAVQAFERAAVDYVLKPVTDERLAATVERLKDRLLLRQRAEARPVSPQLLEALAALREHLGEGSPARRERLAWIRAAVGAQIRMIPVEDVVYFEANDKYTSVYTAEGEALIRTPLKELLAQLDPDRFWQIHRGTIVNVAEIAGATRDVTGRVKVNLKGRPEKLAVSRAFAHRFRQM